MTSRYEKFRSRRRVASWQFSGSPVGIALMTRDCASLFLARGPIKPLDHVFAVRRDWPDGTHELCCPRRMVEQGYRMLAADLRYWQDAPIPPQQQMLVTLTFAEFRSHSAHAACSSLACPTWPVGRVVVVPV